MFLKHYFCPSTHQPLKTYEMTFKTEKTLYFNKSKYTLKSSVIPEIYNNVIRKDGGAGGVKLVYRVKTFRVRKFMIAGVAIYIRVSLNSLKEIKTYLRPFKKNWSVKRNKLSRNDWGKPKHPLTSLWLELEFDHYDIKRNIPLVKNKIENHKFKAFLQKHNEFFIISNI